MKLLLILSLLATAWANLNKDSFINIYEDLESIVEAELVFQDELRGEEIYKVTFTYKEIECASAPTPSGDACGETGELLTDCEYVLVSPEYNEISATGISCEADLEDVTKPDLKDEL